MEKIGDGFVVMLGAELTESYTKFRQDNNFITSPVWKYLMPYC